MVDPVTLTMIRDIVTIIGVLIFGLINNGLNLLGVDPLFRDAVKGGIILIAILIDQWGRE